MNVKKQLPVIIVGTAMTLLSVPTLAQNGQHGPPGHSNYGQSNDKVLNHSQAEKHGNQDAKHAKKVVQIKPHQSWKVGHQFPHGYRSKAYQVYDYGNYHLSRPAKNQQWYRINGDYVLVNVISHSILQIIAGR